MSEQEKAKLLRQAGKLYTLGITVEKRREKLRRLVDEGVPYDSEQMIAALEKFEAAEREWNSLEQEHLQYRAQLRIKLEDTHF